MDVYKHLISLEVVIIFNYFYYLVNKDIYHISPFREKLFFNKPNILTPFRRKGHTLSDTHLFTYGKELRTLGDYFEGC